MRVLNWSNSEVRQPLPGCRVVIILSVQRPLDAQLKRASNEMIGNFDTPQAPGRLSGSEPLYDGMLVAIQYIGSISVNWEQGTY
jgi:hypothetical protein